MNRTRAVMLSVVSAICSQTNAASIPSSPVLVNTTGGIIVDVVSPGIPFSERRLKVVSTATDPVTITGTLDTFAGTVKYDPVDLILPAASSSRTYEITTITPPICDFNGCTPEIIEAKQFRVTITVDSMTATIDQPDYLASSVGVDSASFFPPPLSMGRLGPRISGTWTIEGPTETKTGQFSRDSGLRVISDQIDLTRTPPETGPVTQWSPLIDDKLWISGRRFGTIRDNIIVDGQNFDLRPRVPEPSSFVCGVIGLLTICCYHIKRGDPISSAAGGRAR